MPFVVCVATAGILTVVLGGRRTVSRCMDVSTLQGRARQAARRVRIFPSKTSNVTGLARGGDILSRQTAMMLLRHRVGVLGRVGLIGEAGVYSSAMVFF